jgi:hypothetical protein
MVFMPKCSLQATKVKKKKFTHPPEKGIDQFFFFGLCFATDLFTRGGIGELGLAFKPSPSLTLTLDLGVQGYVGKRRGVTDSLQAKWEF